MSTNEPMTQERLNAIRERVDAVSAPWMPAKPDEVYRADGCERVAWCIDPETVELIAHAPDDLADLLAEVERLRHFESIVSWRYGDTTDGKTRADMIERAARASYEKNFEAIPWGKLSEWVRAYWREDARTALDAALGTGEGGVSTDPWTGTLGETLDDLAQWVARGRYESPPYLPSQRRTRWDDVPEERRQVMIQEHRKLLQRVTR